MAGVLVELAVRATQRPQMGDRRHWGSGKQGEILGHGLGTDT